MSDVPAESPSFWTKYGSLWLTLALIVLALTAQGLMNFGPSLRDSTVVVTTRGQTRLYTSSAWMLAPILLPAGVLLVIGIVCVRKPHTVRRVAGAALLLAAFLFTAVFAPTVLHGRLVLSPDGFTWTYGFWWKPTTKSVRFDALTGMAVVHRRKADRRSDDSLECYTRNGETIAMPLGDHVRAAVPAIERYAQPHGVWLIDIQRRGPGRPDEAGGTNWPIVGVLCLPAVILVSLYAYVYTANRRHPTNRMSRRLQAGDAAGAVTIGESVPEARLDFGVRCNLVVAYWRAGRQRDARALLAALETEGWQPGLCTEAQHGKLLDELRGVVGLHAASEPPESPPPQVEA